MGAEKYNAFLGEEKKKTFKDHLFKWKTEKQLLALYEEGYSPSQIAKLFEHQIGFAHLRESTSFFQGRQSRSFRIFPEMNAKIFAKRLADLLPYSEDLHRIHLSKPQWWKIRCSHLDKSEDEVKEIASNQFLNWQKSTCEKRKKTGTYNPVYSLDYWKNSSSNPAESLEQYKREISPRCVEFWLKRGLDLNEAKKRIGDICRTGAHATLKSLNGKCSSVLESRIYSLLNDSSIDRQLFLGKYAYDFCKRSSKKIVEINGTYWHADPRIYQNLDTKLVHGTVQEIRENDERKISYAKSKGWEVLIIWELDYCKSPNEVVRSIMEFFKQ